MAFFFIVIIHVTQNHSAENSWVTNRDIQSRSTTTVCVFVGVQLNRLFIYFMFWKSIASVGTRLIKPLIFFLSFFSFFFFCEFSFGHRIYPQLPPQKSVWVTYVLWLFGGIFGAHHLYLGNDLQAFIWWTTLGGYFGMGWIGEAFRIPEMVREANEDPGFVERFVYQLRTTPKPPFSTSRFLFAIMVGYLWAQLFMVAIPQDKFGGIDWSYLHWLVPFVGALGTHVIAFL